MNNHSTEVIADLEARLAKQVDRAEAAERRCDDLLHACIYALTAAEEQIDSCSLAWYEVANYLRVAEYLHSVIIKVGGKIDETT